MYPSWLLLFNLNNPIQALLNTIKRWSWAFKKHELDHIINSLNELQQFIVSADAGLEVEVPEGEYNCLIE